MKNKMSDVRDHLVAALEMLGDEGVAAEEMAQRIERAKAISLVAGTYIAAVRTELEAFRVVDETTLASSAIEAAPSGLAMRVIEGGRAKA